MRRAIQRSKRVEAVEGGFMSGRRSSRSIAQQGMVLKETFAPILYVLRYRDIEQAIA